MTDYGRQISFGVFPTPAAAAVDQAIAIASLADQAGLDLVGIQDHPYQGDFLDTWSLMAVILERTTRVHVFPDVASLPLRPPAVLAKAAASLDVLSGGRFELGLGAGAFWPGIVAMGGPSRDPRAAGEALTEAVDVIRLMWSGRRGVRFAGSHYSLGGVHPGPRPAHDIGLWLGVGGPKMLGVAGRTADGWISSSSYYPPPALPDMHRRVDTAAAASGRDPAEIRRVYNVFGAITPGASHGPFDGPVDQWIDTLTELALTGTDTFVFGAAGDDLDQIRQFAERVVPGVRDQVGEARQNAKPRG